MTPPLDPRLLRRARPARRHFGLVVGSGVVTAGLVILQAGLLAHVIVHASDGLAALRAPMVALLAVLVARGALAYLGEVSALRAAADVRSALRRDVAAKALALGPSWAGQERAGQVATLMTRGLDSLDTYFARYLPALVLAPLVPLAVIARVAGADLTSCLVIVLTVPLIPLFMVLVGMHTKQRTARQWSQLSRLGGHFLDVVEGLPTLKVFGRAKAQVESIRQVSNDYRRTTMATLRVAFTSALVLELLATLSTAVVAVEVGLRLLHGHLPYETAMLVLLLTPEAYLPLRALGATFHASADGAAAVVDALDILEASPSLSGGDVAVDLRMAAVAFAGVSVRYPDRESDALADVDLVIEAGEHVALVGPSGSGKSTLVAALLGFVEPRSGTVSIGGVPLTEVDLAALRSQVAWVPQAPHVFAGTVGDNIRLGVPEASDADLERASGLAGLAEVVAGLPDGYATVLGDRGVTLSTGQRQRMALARAFLRDARLIILDEPAAHLDGASSDAIRVAVRRLAAGRTLIVVTHDLAWCADVDRTITIDAGRVLRPADLAFGIPA